MIEAFFLLSAESYDVLIERHLRSWNGISRGAVVEFFKEQVSNFDSLEDIPPLLVAPAGHQYYYDHSVASNSRANKSNPIYIVKVIRDGLLYLAAFRNEVPPLLVIEMLIHIARVFQMYFPPKCDELAIKDNFSTVYQLLDEMLDNGWPLTTEPNALMDIIRPPSIINKLEKAVLGSSLISSTTSNVAESLPTGTVSNMPWRKANVKYANNEIYIDIIEEIDAVLDASGTIVSSDVRGYIMGQSHLSGVPDLLMTFSDPSVIDDCSFHPCVRYSRFDRDQVISFVPPDGEFELARYRVKDASDLVNPPLFCRPTLVYSPPSAPGAAITGQLNVTVGVRTTSGLKFSPSKSGSWGVERVMMIIPFPKVVRTVDLQVSQGRVIFDEVRKEAMWAIGDFDAKTHAKISGKVILSNGVTKAEANSHLLLEWKIPLASVSGLLVSGLSLTNEAYSPYKGVRTTTQSGRYQIRFT